jgi:hypothetical protein
MKLKYKIKQITDFRYNVYQFCKNVPLFLRLAWGWRKWDSVHTLDVFCQLLDEHAKDLEQDDCHINAHKYARRARTSAGLLRQAYDLNYTKINERHSKLLMKHFTSRRLMSKLDVYSLEKLSRSTQEIAKGQKLVAWAYLNKYIEHFWT